MEDEELHWLAGLLEGEGCFMKGTPSAPNSPRISLHMTDLDIVERVSKIFKRKLHPVKKQKVHYKQSWVVHLTGYRAVDLMNTLKPLMGIRRKQQIEKALKDFDPIKRERAALLNRKLSPENLKWAKENGNLSLRKRAKILDVDHETLRQRLLHGYIG